MLAYGIVAFQMLLAMLRMSEAAATEVSDPTVPTWSIIDVLSTNESFSSILLTLQHSDLIDYVNELENVTFLAPVNSAFERRDVAPGSKMSKNDLQRFIIDQPVFREDINGINILPTLNNEGSPYIDDFPVSILLDHHVEMENGKREVYLIENANVISDDIFVSTFNNVVLAIDDLLQDTKESVCDYFANSLNRDTGEEQFKTFSSLIVGENSCQSAQLSNVTFLIPSDDSLGFNQVEESYLLNVRGLKDKNELISNFVLDGIIGGDLFNETAIVAYNWNDIEMEISSTDMGDELILNETIHSTSSNYLLSDGIVHYFEDHIFDYKNGPYFPSFTPRKYLIGLDYEQFVDEVDFRKLSYLIDENFLDQTIFVSNDYKTMGSLQSQLKYHFIEGADSVQLGANQTHKLLTSNFCTELQSEDSGNVDNGKEKQIFCQRIKLERGYDGSLLLNSNTGIVNKDPYRVGNTSIYILDDDINLPPKLQVAIAAELTRSGKSIELFKQFGLLKELSRGADSDIYTIFFPTSKLWSSLDLTLDYLMNNPDLLKHTLENLVIKGLLYHDFEGTTTLETYSNITVTISDENDDNKDDDLNLITIDNRTDVQISFGKQILYSHGVVHPISDNLPLPKDLEITNTDLLTTLDSEEFESILSALNLTSYLQNQSYSIMLPMSKSLLQENITHLLTDVKYLEKFAMLHILPPGSLDMIMDCYSTSSSPLNKNLTTTIPTLLNDTHLTCRELASGGMMVSITEGSGNEVRVLRHGLSLVGSDNESFNRTGILLLDRPLNPAWMNESPGKLYLHLPFIAIVLGILIGILFVMLLFGCCMVLTMGGSKKKGVQLQNDAEQEEGNVVHVVSVNETMPLIPEEEEEMADDGIFEEGHMNSNSAVDGGVNGHKEAKSKYLHGLKAGEYALPKSKGLNAMLNIAPGRQLGVKKNANAKTNANNNSNKNNYHTFDAEYSMNASASPIDMEFNQSV